MQFGFQMMLRGAAGTPEGMSAIATKGEALGFSAVALNDHMLVPGDIASRYPYSEDGAWAGAKIGECNEQLTVLAYLAARTRTLKLLTSVMVVPHRDPVLTAKILATADLLSDGRVIVGCGAGWMQEEFAAVGAPPFAERGKVTDEYISIFKTLWTEENPSFDGKYARFSNLLFSPKPVQRPHPPVWIGGESTPALRRAVKLGDGWFPASNNPTFPLNTPARFASRMADLKREAEKAGRDPASLDVGFFHIELPEPAERKAADGSRKTMTGKPADLAADLAAFEAAGAKTIVMIFQRPDLAATLDNMEWFATEVMPLVS